MLIFLNIAQIFLKNNVKNQTGISFLELNLFSC